MPNNSVNKLVRGDEELHLEHGFDGIWLQPNGYSPAIVEQNRDGTWPREVNEVLNLRVIGELDDIARAQRALKIMGRQAGEFIRNQTDQNQTWWHQRLPCETYERRALVRHIRTENASPVYDPPYSPSPAARDYRLGIARGPFWETLTSFTTSTFGVVATSGDLIDSSALLTGTVAGDTAARIAIMAISSSAGSGDLAKFWVGWRTDLLGDQSLFEPVWQCEDGTPSIADTTDTGTEMTTTFATDADMTERFTLTLDQAVAAGNEDEQRGYHLVLLRARMANAATEARLRMKSGFESTAEWFTHDFVTVNSDSYLYYSMGSIQIPTKSLHEIEDEADWKDEIYFSVAIEAELVTGTPPGDTLIMERFVIIPQAEGWCSVANTDIPGFAEPDKTRVMTTPGDQFLVRPGQDAVAARNPRLEVDRTLGFYLPVGDASFVFAAQQATQQVLADVAGVQFAAYYPRWTEFRGDDI